MSLETSPLQRHRRMPQVHSSVLDVTHGHIRFQPKKLCATRTNLISSGYQTKQDSHPTIYDHICMRYVGCFVGNFFRTWCGCHDVAGCFCGQAHMASTSFWSAKSVMSACFSGFNLETNQNNSWNLHFLSSVCIPCC